MKHKETYMERTTRPSLCLGHVSTTVTGLDFSPNFSILMKLPFHQELAVRHEGQE